MKTRIPLSLLAGLVILFSHVTRAPAQGAIVWNGPLITFTNLAGSDWTQTANQDHLTDNVWLTRATSSGIFNAASEGFFTHNVSPADTEWAPGLLANYATLTYTSWEAAYGGPGILNSRIVGQDTVLHLITDNIYIGIKFLSFGGSGGGFTYQRTTIAPVPEPATSALAITGALALIGTVLRKKLRG